MSSSFNRGTSSSHSTGMRTGNEATVVMPASVESPSPHVVGPGTIVGSYELGAVLGAGGCGTVFEARHLESGRKAAVKVMHDDVAQSNEMVERFVREVQAANLIRHPNIVDIWDLGRLSTGQPFCVMELLEGVNLGALIKRGNFTPAEALEILEPVCAAVDAAHRAGIVHRDLKASNIQISGPAGDRRIKLLDFGIAKLTELGGGQALTAMGRKLGTPTSMSPEQIRGALVDSRTDIYALGVLLFYMLTCRHPFEAREPFELERMHLEHPPPRASDLVAVGAEMDAVVVRCLAKRPAERYQTVTEFVEGLRAAVARSAHGAASGRELRPATAGAILIEVVVDENTEALDDATLMDLAGALERAEALLVEAGLQVALQTGSAAVGVSLLSGNEDEQRDQRARLVEQAAQLHRALEEREGKQSGVGVTVCVHVDQALVGQRESGDPDVTGPILSLGGWMPPSGGGLYLTSTTVDGLTIAIDKFSII